MYRSRPTSVQSRIQYHQPIIAQPKSKDTSSELSNFPKSEIKLAKILLDRPPPHVSALSWVVLDQSTKEVLFGKLEKDRREIASLTKIMTIYTVLQLCDKHKVDLNTPVVVHDSVTEVIGTTANLIPGD